MNIFWPLVMSRRQLLEGCGTKSHSQRKQSVWSPTEMWELEVINVCITAQCDTLNLLRCYARNVLFEVLW